MSSQEPTLQVQINQIDYTLAQPGLLDNASLPRVPIIRIYGPSSTNQKACVHIHQVYPYFFIEYNGTINPDSVNRYIAKLTVSLNHAIAISTKRNPTNTNSQFVRAIILVKGVHFYGFHSSYTPFLKVLMADPAIVNRAVTIMQSGTVMRTRFRVYESHLSYILQFMCDFGLYGCGWINLGDVHQRGHDDDAEVRQQASSFSCPKLSPHFRQSRMSLEVDVMSHQILNRHLLTARNVHHKLTIPGPSLLKEPFVMSVRELWEDERRRRIASGLTPSPTIPVDPSENSRGKGGEWVAEARWWDELRKKIEQEKDVPTTIAGGNKRWEKWVMTTFESVEALWEAEYKTWKPGQHETDTNHITPVHQVQDENPFESATAPGPWKQQSKIPQSMDLDIDEKMLSSQEMSQLVEKEERAWAKRFGENDIVGHEEIEDRYADEDGPCAEVELFAESEVNDPTNVRKGGTSSSPRKPIETNRSNPFQDAWLNLAGRKRPRRSESPDQKTPTKSRKVLPYPESPTKKKGRHRDLSPIYDVIMDDKSHSNSSSKLRELDAGSQGISVPHKTNQITSQSDSNCPLPTIIPIVTVTSSESSVSQANSSHEGHANGSQSSSSLSAWISPNVKPSSSVYSSPASMRSSTNRYVYSVIPPSVSELLSSCKQYGIPSKVYRDPFYSKNSDAPDHPREYAGLIYRLKGGEGVQNLEEWRDGGLSLMNKRGKLSRNSNRLSAAGWEYASCPPSVREVKRWLHVNPHQVVHRERPQSQIEGPTPANPSGARLDAGARSEYSVRESQNMTMLSLEVFAPSRGDRVPDADVDEIVAVFYTFSADGRSENYEKGMVVVKNEHLDPRRLRNFCMEVVPDELELLNKVIDIVIDVDPDIIVGWEVQTASWGYMNSRGRHYGFEIGELIARAPSRNNTGGNDQWGLRTSSTFQVVGRHVFNVWRIMRVEQNLGIYTFENVAFHVLKRRIPRYSFSTLTEWYKSPDPVHTTRLLRHLSERTSTVLDILDEAETVTKNAEFARVFGVDFFSVISRGSQFKVESFMFRIAKPESFVLLSPSKEDVGKQNAAECMPLIMEPLSAFYNGPLVVLDFQSLYPSIMIAYNYCYSTCLGRVGEFQGQNKLGVMELHHPAGLLKMLQDHITVAPNGIMYVKSDVRKGLLGRMLTELLETRVMVKQAMKSARGNKALGRILDARQLSLKYIANVTYGYTSATYSGRMPAVEIADSIVQSGRETLEKAVRVINATKKWGGKVVYGDTDSLFIYLPGKTKEQAFRIGQDMADTITAMNPSPVKLKFEKVYLPCVLMAKKRYVGFKYENPDDSVPVFDAKGIETVRRDGVAAQQKMTETCLKILFRTQDLSEVKDYCTRSWLKILRNKVSIQDFVFAKEVKLGTYSDKVPPPPGATVAARRLMQDENDEPQYGERVPYVIVKGEPQSRLVDRAVSPEECLRNRRLSLDGAYYISRVLIPPLERIFNLVGADVRAWYDEMPKAMKVDQVDPLLLSPRKNKGNTANKFKIDEHFQSSQCLHCGALAQEGICGACRRDPQAVIPALLGRIHKAESRMLNTQQICVACTASAAAEPIRCENYDCPWFFERTKAVSKSEFLEGLWGLMDDIEFSQEYSYERTDDLL